MSRLTGIWPLPNTICMFARNITFDTSSMKRRQQLSFALNIAVFLLCLILLIYSYMHIDVVPGTMRLTLLALTSYEMLFLIVGAVRYLNHTHVEEVTVTSKHITINGDKYPIGEEGDRKVVIDQPLARDVLNLVGRSVSVRDAADTIIKRYWIGPSHHSHSEQRRTELIEAVKEARENIENEDLIRELEGNGDDNVRIEFPVDAMRNQLMISSILLMVMGVLLWGVGKFTLGNDTFIYHVGTTFGILTVIYGMVYGLFSMYNMSRAVKVAEVSSKGIAINNDFYDFDTDPKISFNITLNKDDNDQGVDLSVYLTIVSGQIKRKYWAGPKNEKRSAEARRRLMVAIDKFAPDKKEA